MARQDFVDRSNTNWTPWPRLAKVMSHNAQVVFGVSMIMAGAGVIMWWRRKVGFVPRTVNDEWYQESLRLAKEKPVPALPEEDFEGFGEEDEDED